MQGIDADQIEAQFACRNTRELEPLAHDVEREPATRERTGTGIGDLALADKTVDITDRYLERRRASAAATAADANTILSELLDLDLREVRDHVRLDISRRIMHFVKQLLLAGLRGQRHRSHQPW